MVQGTTEDEKEIGKKKGDTGKQVDGGLGRTQYISLRKLPERETSDGGLTDL